MIPFWRRKNSWKPSTTPVKPFISPDLEIVVEKTSSLRFQLRTSDTGHALHLQSFDHKLEEDPPEILGLQGFLLKIARKNDNDPEEAERRFAELGAELAERILPEELRQALEKKAGDHRSLLIISEELWIPWEILRTSPEPQAPFLGERFAITHWLPEKPQHLFLPLKKLRVLRQSSGAPQRAPEEVQLITNFSSPGRESSPMTATIQEVRQALKEGDADGWHLCGHVTPPKGFEGSAFCLDKQNHLTLETFSQGIQNHARFAPLIFLNACHTAAGADTPIGSRSWVAKLIEAGAGALIGTSWAVGDSPALAFTRFFYEAFLGAIPIGEASRKAREILRREFPGDPARFAYSVFAHPLAICSEPLQNIQEARDQEQRFQESFALLRALKSSYPGGSLRLIPWQEDAHGTRESQLVITDEEGMVAEQWFLHGEPQPFEVHLRLLREARAQQANQAVLLGSAQCGALDKKSDDLVAWLEGIRTINPSDPSTERLFTESLPDAVVRARETLSPPEAQDSLKEFKRFRLEGESLPTLYAHILECARQGYPDDLLGGVTAEEAFAYRAGPALVFLQARRGKDVTLDELRTLLRPRRLGTTSRELSEGELDAGLKKLLNVNQERIRRPLFEHSVDLETLYVPPQGRLIPQALRPWDRTSSSQPIDDLGAWLIDELLDNQRAFLLLLGDFGHGKTTLAQRTVAALSRRSTEYSRIPVFLTLRDYRPKRGLRDIVAEAIRGQVPLTDELWNEGRWILFLDGFDELNILHQEAEGWLRWRFSDICEKARRPNIQIVLTSRPTLFLDPDLGQQVIEGVDRVELLSFDRHQVETWLRHWGQANAPITIADLEEHNLLEVAQTPVLLMMIAMMFRDQQFNIAPRNRAEIYRRFFLWTSKDGGLQLTSKELQGPSSLPLNAKHRPPANYQEILRFIAWQLTNHPDARGGLLHLEVLLKEIQVHFGQKLSTRADNLDHRLFVAHAFRENQPEHLEYLHQSLREYLVAEKFYEAYKQQRTQENPPLRESYLIDSPPSAVTLRFFRELIEVTPEQDLEILAVSPSNRKFWADSLEEVLQGAFKGSVSYFHRKGELIESSSRARSLDNALLIDSVMDFLFDLYVGCTRGRPFVGPFESLSLLQVLLGSSSDYLPIQDFLCQAWTALEWREATLQGIDFTDFDLSRGLFEDCNFLHCIFEDTKFSDVRMRRTEVGRAEAGFWYCQFRSISWNTINLEEIVLEGCHFKQLSIEPTIEAKDISFRSCHFESSTLPLKSLQGARFFDCTFRGTDIGTEERFKNQLERCLVWTEEGWRPV